MFHTQNKKIIPEIYQGKILYFICTCTYFTINIFFINILFDSLFNYQVKRNNLQCFNNLFNLHVLMIVVCILMDSSLNTHTCMFCQLSSQYMYYICSSLFQELIPRQHKMAWRTIYKIERMFECRTSAGMPQKLWSLLPQISVSPKTKLCIYCNSSIF